MWFSDNSINPLGASDTTVLRPLPCTPTTVRGRVGGSISSWVFCIQSLLWGQMAPKTFDQQGDWQLGYPFISRERDAELSGSPSSCLPSTLPAISQPFSHGASCGLGVQAWTRIPPSHSLTLNATALFVIFL